MKLSIALIAVTGAFAGSAISAVNQRSSAQDWSTRAVRAEQELVQTRAEADTLRGGLKDASVEGTKLTERIDELANEKAQSADDRSASEVQRDTYKRIAQEYATVSSAWQSCVKGHEKYEDVLSEPARYDANDVKRFLKELETLCLDAENKEQSLRSQLGQ